MSHHDAVHVAMAPYCFYCTILATCDVNDANSCMPFYVSMGIELIEWSKQQHILVQLLLLASLTLMAFAIVVIPAYLLSGSSSFQMQRVILLILTVDASLNKGLKVMKEN